ncbi:MAG TPA: HlyD family efflux transporter periplasmic adaptor subunit [Verrucomicrobiae bacterium]|nr:HlyD family efflux transporter periplasmic adaptor subunit [Verrucomicrobiae bacterium]
MKFNLRSGKMLETLFTAGLAAALAMGTGCSKSGSSLEVIRMVKTRKGDMNVTAAATGEVKPYNRVEIKPPIAGRVEEVLVKEGDSVTQGQVLAWMSSTERAALLDAARSRGPEEYQKWLNSYKPAPLLAPLDGKIIVRAVEPGQTVTPTDPIVVISDRLIIKALVDETDLAQITLGQKTQIHLDAYPDKIIDGKVDHISYESQLVNNVNVYDIDILPDEIPPAFRSGMTANVTFLVSEHPDVLLLPSEAIVEWPRKVKRPEGAQFAVYKKDFGRLTPVPVQIGASDGRMTEITSGLKPGQEVAITRKKQSQTGSAFSPMGGGRQGGGGGSGSRGRS